MKSSRPYLARALYEWLLDNELTPYLVVDATLPGVEVPRSKRSDRFEQTDGAPPRQAR